MLNAISALPKARVFSAAPVVATTPVTVETSPDQVQLGRDRPYIKPSPSRLKEQADRAMAVAASSAPLFGVGGLLFPDSHGKIEHLALQLGDVEFNKPLPKETHDALMGVWDQLFTHMSPESHFTVVCANSSGVADVQQLAQNAGLKADRVEIIDAQAQKGMSIWIRDSMLPTLDEQGNTKILIQDRTYWPGPEDNKVAELIDKSHDNIYSQPHPALRIDGGNVVSNRNLSLVGIDSINQMRDRLHELAVEPGNYKQMLEFYEHTTGTSPADDMDKFWADMPKLVLASEFHRPVMVVGTDDLATANVETQPAFHIDMAVTPIGDKKFLVGDPKLAIEAFQALSPEERAKVNQEMIKAGTLKEGDDLIGRLCEVNGGADYQSNYDRVATELKEAGFEVERIPSMIGLRTTWSLPYLTYNNCMMEIYDNDKGQTVKNVYLPQYGCQPLDDWSRRVYQENGYTVVPLQMSAVSKLEGAIRCSCYALERDLKNS